MHIKRKTISGLWPIPRTGTKYLATPIHNKSTAIPLVVVLRDVLELVKTKKELKKLLHEKKIQVNCKLVNEIAYPIRLFDTISLLDSKKHYRAELDNTRITMKEVDEHEAKKRAYKVICKKVLPGNKIQINFADGRNTLTKENIQTGEFAVIDLTNNKILKVIKLEKNSPVVIIGGKHTGKRGKILEIVTEGQNKVAVVKTHNEEIKSNIENLFVD